MRATTLALLCAWPALLPASAQTPDAAAHETQPASDGAGEPVLLEFAWPEGLTAEVEMRQRRVEGHDGQESDVTTRSRYRMTVRAHPRGLAITYGDGRLLEVDGQPPDESVGAVGTALASLAGAGTTYVVSEDGMLLEVEDAGGASEQALAATAAERWNSMVWFWAWEEFEPEAVYAFEADAPSPLLPGVAVPMEYRLGFLRRVPCYAGAPADSCVAVEGQTTSDREVVRGLVARYLEGLVQALGEAPEVDVEDARQESLFSVVLEPATMIPHEFRTSRSMSMRVRVGQESNTTTQIDEIILSFRYPAPQE
ncbi:MAG TPA: hypothetical protein VK837_08575 [Longimicrobiales bacterium]|nr:hypothetical protein [Longimicrobiales bacterium]